MLTPGPVIGLTQQRVPPFRTFAVHRKDGTFPVSRQREDYRMRNIKRAMVASALALPLTLGAAGVASADSFSQEHSHAGPNGSMSHSVQSGTGADGGSSYEESMTSAGPDGANSSGTSANAGSDGSTSFDSFENSAGSDGVSSSETSASTDGSDSEQGALSGVLGGLGL